jgi:hypothetical protein
VVRTAYVDVEGTMDAGFMSIGCWTLQKFLQLQEHVEITSQDCSFYSGVGNYAPTIPFFDRLATSEIAEV